MSLCFLLAAGKGERLKPFTDQCPKPALRFFNLPLAFYGFYLARKGNFHHFILNKHYLPHHIEKLTHDLKGFCDSIQTLDETHKLLGSGGALWNGRALLKDQPSFLVANGDVVFFPSDETLLARLLAQHQENGALATLLTMDHPEGLKSFKGVWVNESGQVRGFGDSSPGGQNLKLVYYTGYKVFSNGIFKWLPEGESNIFYEVLSQAIHQRERVETYHVKQGAWYETGNFKAYIKALRLSGQNHLKEIGKRQRFFAQRNFHQYQ